MCSIKELPSTYRGVCTSIINDKFINVVARNVVTLLLTAQLPPLVAAELVVHFWYSARLTHEMLATIDKYVRGPVAEVFAKVDKKSDSALLSKIWTFGGTGIRVLSYKPQWATLHRIIEAKHDVLQTEQNRRDVALAASRIDHWERELYTLSGSRRKCSARFRETGVLLPYGSCLDHFDRSNP